MTDDELEEGLRLHFREIDPTVAPGHLHLRIDDALDARSRRPTLTTRTRPAFAAAMAAVVLVAVGLAFRPGGFLSSPDVSPSPTQASTSPSPTTEPSFAPVEGATVDQAGTIAGGGLWAVHAGTLLVSTDAGGSWRRSSIPVPAGTDAPTFVLDPHRAWSLTYGPGSTEQTGSSTDALQVVVNRTVDGGRTWNAVTLPGNYPGTSQAIVFVDARHGYLFCSATRISSGVSTVLRTDDGGATWSVGGTGSWLGSMFAASDASTLWAGAVQEAGPVTRPIFDVSRDGGRSWEDARLPGLEGHVGGAQTWLPGPPLFSDPANGLVTVDSTDGNGNLETRIYRTVDAGRSWSIAADQPVEASAGVAALDADNWLLPVDNPIGLLASADRGRTWQDRKLNVLTVDQWMTWIGAIDATHAAALVPTGHSSEDPSSLFLTTDGGQTWHPADLGASTSPAPTPAPTASALVPSSAQPSGTLPPVSDSQWTGLSLQALDHGPVGASVTTWPGGYLAIGLPSDSASVAGWVSQDGRSWSQLPAGTFGPAALVQVAPCADGVIVAIESPEGAANVWRSTDGVSWTANPAPRLSLGAARDLAGNDSGAIAVLDDPSGGVAFSADCVTWQTVSMPGHPEPDARGVAAVGAGFVAVGDSGTSNPSPAAWRSSDGSTWTEAVVQAHPDTRLFEAEVGKDGFVARSTTGDVPGLTSFWTSSDATHWKVSAADPLGVQQSGEGVGSDVGNFLADGNRILGYGSRGFPGPSEYWISFDGTHWKELTLTGDVTAAKGEDVSPSLMRDGVLFSSETGSWLGAATP
jgi:photosystem II stability/assembly factor-like uncharacterized protein